jgi:hypothetical protein
MAPWKIDKKPMAYPEITRIGAIVKAMKPRPYSPLSSFMHTKPIDTNNKLMIRNS